MSRVHVQAGTIATVNHSAACMLLAASLSRDSSGSLHVKGLPHLPRSVLSLAMHSHHAAAAFASIAGVAGAADDVVKLASDVEECIHGAA